MADYELMHKHVCVADIDIHEDCGTIVGIGAVRSLEHMPVGTVAKGMFVDVARLKHW